ncbi:MAG: hypothetical protein RLZZ584_3493 [Pseudomonadota bacterium]
MGIRDAEPQALPPCPPLARDACAAGSADAECVCSLVIEGRQVALLCVDGRVPRQLQTRANARPRFEYAAGELGHFEFCGHRYALVPDQHPTELPADLAECAGRIHQLLTNRELQIVQLVCMGLLTKQIADKLRLSEFTVRSYLKTVYCKLGVRSRAAMVYRYAQAISTVTPHMA